MVNVLKLMYLEHLHQKLQIQNKPLKEHDPELFNLIEKEKDRQFRGLEMIASEVAAVLKFATIFFP